MRTDSVVKAAVVRIGRESAMWRPSEHPKDNLDAETSKRMPRIAEDLDLEGFNRLTQRQRQIVWMLACGKTNAQMAAELGITPRTVHFHRTNIRRQLGLHSPWGILRYAILAKQMSDDHLSP